MKGSFEGHKISINDAYDSGKTGEQEVISVLHFLPSSQRNRLTSCTWWYQYVPVTSNLWRLSSHPSSRRKRDGVSWTPQPFLIWLVVSTCFNVLFCSNLTNGVMMPMDFHILSGDENHQPVISLCDITRSPRYMRIKCVWVRVCVWKLSIHLKWSF